MEQSFKIKGRIIFDPPNKTHKHNKQGVWKKVAIVQFYGGLCGYYQWFIKKRYNLPLGSPLRGPHITFINDAKRDMNDDGKDWNAVKKKWNNKEIEVELSTDVRGDGENWWLVVPEEGRKGLHDIRAELGLGRPYFGLHMTVGTAIDAHDRVTEDTVDKILNVRTKRFNIEHSKYIMNLLTKGLIK